MIAFAADVRFLSRFWSRPKNGQRLKAILAFALCGFVAQPAFAEQINVPNTANLQYEISSSKFYIRNFSTYDASWLPCCYNYYIDLTTDQGRAMFSLVLTKMASAQPMSFYVVSKATGGAITSVGYYGP
jgi:hypothetical protein